MCLISYHIYWYIFGRRGLKHPPVPACADGAPKTAKEALAKIRPQPEAYPENVKKDRLMGPRFEVYLAWQDAGRSELTRRPAENWQIRAEDKTLLNGYFIPADEPTDRVAVMVHGYNSSAYKGWTTLALKYIAAGWNVFLTDNRACGRSAGRWMTFGLKESRDTRLWVKEILRRRPGSRIMLHGVSLGGATVCQMSSLKLPEEVRCIVSDCAFADLTEELAHTIRLATGLKPEAFIKMADVWFRHFNGCHIADVSPLESVKTARVPVFFVHGEADSYIPVNDAKRLFNACGAPKELLTVPGASHGASYVYAGDEYLRRITAFSERYL